METDLLGKVRHHLHRARYPEAINCSQESRHHFPASSQAGILLVRGLLLQGYFAQAERICQAILQQTSEDSYALWEGNLWLGWLQIYTRGDTAPAITISKALLQEIPVTSHLI